MENETRKRIENLEKKVEKLEQNQREIVSLLSQINRGYSYYIDKNGDIKSFVDD